MSPDVLIILLCLVLYLGLGQGVYVLYYRARKAHQDHVQTLFLWPILLLMLVFLDSSLEW